MQTLTLTATTRSITGKGTRALRRQSQVPAVVYGHGQPTRSLTLDARAFTKVYSIAKESTLVDLVVDNEAPVKVIIHDVQSHTLNGETQHVDLHQVKMTEKLETEIPLHFEGESAAVKELGGVLVKSIDQVKVSCLPADLVQTLTVDISPLKTFEDAIHVRDIAVPNGITILTGADEVVATVAEPRSEQELASLEEKVEADASQVEVVGKKEATDEEAAAEESDKPAKKEE